MNRHEYVADRQRQNINKDMRMREKMSSLEKLKKDMNEKRKVWLDADAAYAAAAKRKYKAALKQAPAASSERVSISRECAEYAAECMSAETRRVEGICERLLDGKVPDKIHQRFKLIKELRAALEKNNGTM